MRCNSTLPPSRTVPDGDTVGCRFSHVRSSGLLREIVNNKMAFPLPQSIQHTVPGPCGVCTLITPPQWDGTSQWQRSPGASWWVPQPCCLSSCGTQTPCSFFSVSSDVVGFVSTVTIRACKFPGLSPSPRALQVPPRRHLAIKVSTPWVSPLAGDFLQPSRCCPFQRCRVSARLFR